MKILISAGIFPPDIGGPADFVPRIASWLVRQGHRVEVVCWSDTTGTCGNYSFPVHRILRHGSRGARSLRTVRMLMEAGRDADLFFINGLALEAQTAASLLSKPAVHKVVGDFAWERARGRGWFTGTIDAFQTAPGTLRLRLLRLLRTLPLRRASLIITPSGYLKKMVLGWGVSENRVEVIHNATALDTGDHPLGRGTGTTICTVCRLVPWKGVDRLIALLPRLPQARLVVAGDGPEREALQALAREHQVEARVTFLGQVPHSQLDEVYRNADLFVLNSTYEGMPHVVLEAMAAGVPVVATDAGGTAEVVLHQETGMLIPPGDDEILCDTLQFLIDTPQAGKQLAAKARQRIRECFSESTCYAAFEAAFDRVAVKGCT